mgnify:CR=1 FL=1
MDFGRRLAQIQLQRELTNRDLGELLGVYPQQVSRWRQARDVKLSVAATIASALGMSVDDFITDLKLEE